MSAAHMSTRLNRFFRTAVLAGVEASVRLHVERGDPVNAVDDAGMTPLMLAAARNHAHVCQILLDAGADATLRDASGKGALEYALAARARGAEEVLQRAMQVGAAVTAEPDAHAGRFRSASDCLEGATQASGGVAETPSTDGRGDAAHDDPAQSGPSVPPEALLCVVDDPRGHSDASPSESADDGWEAEADEEAPPQNEELVARAIASQSAMVAREVVDGSEDWGEVEIFLPSKARIIRIVRDSEVDRAERDLLVTVMREGRIAEHEIADLCWLDDGQHDSERARHLKRVIHDLGGLVDEEWPSHEWCSVAHEGSADESAEEADLLSEAQACLSDLVEHRSDPWRFYQRDLSRTRLIGAEDEVRLGQAMEEALDLAQDALAEWPEGLSALVFAAEQVLAGDRAESSVFARTDEEFAASDLPDMADTVVDMSSASDPDVAGPLDANEARDDSSEGLRARVEALRRLMVDCPEGVAPSVDAGPTLRRAALSRSILLELLDIARGRHSEPGERFDQAMSAYLAARAEMMQANLRLVYVTARRYVYSGEPVADLVQEGNIGLMKAVEKYDWRRGFKFSTYATWWIRQQVSRYMADSSRMIRVPVHAYQELQKVQQSVDRMEAMSGRQPTASEIAGELGMPPQKASVLLRLLSTPVPLDDVDLDATTQTTVRLRDDDPADAAYTCEVAEVVGKLMDDLLPKENEIIRMRLGFGEQDELTLEEVGRILGVTRERIRQIEAKAFKRLRQPMRVEKLALDLGVKLASEHRAVQPKPSPATGDADDLTIGELKPPRSNGNLETRLTNALIEEAFELGIPVEDDRSGPSGQLWIRLRSAPDQTTLDYISRLRNAGFHFEPGEGYLR